MHKSISEQEIGLSNFDGSLSSNKVSVPQTSNYESVFTNRITKFFGNFFVNETSKVSNENIKTFDQMKYAKNEYLTDLVIKGRNLNELTNYKYHNYLDYFFLLLDKEGKTLLCIPSEFKKLVDVKLEEELMKENQFKDKSFRLNEEKKKDKKDDELLGEIDILQNSIKYLNDNLRKNIQSTIEREEDTNLLGGYLLLLNSHLKYEDSLKQTISYSISQSNIKSYNDFLYEKEKTHPFHLKDRLADLGKYFEKLILSLTEEEHEKLDTNFSEFTYKTSLNLKVNDDLKTVSLVLKSIIQKLANEPYYIPGNFDKLEILFLKHFNHTEGFMISKLFGLDQLFIEMKNNKLEISKDFHDKISNYIKDSICKKIVKQIEAIVNTKNSDDFILYFNIESIKEPCSFCKPIIFTLTQTIQNILDTNNLKNVSVKTVFNYLEKKDNNSTNQDDNKSKYEDISLKSLSKYQSSKEENLIVNEIYLNKVNSNYISLDESKNSKNNLKKNKKINLINEITKIHSSILNRKIHLKNLYSNALSRSFIVLNKVKEIHLNNRIASGLYKTDEKN